MKVFGPVPSRRLGMSLGINNIPYKICSYSCLYCQVGKAIKMQVHRQPYYKVDEIVSEVEHSLTNIKDQSKYPNYITIVPDGEPTLDENLGELIENLKQFKLPVAVITNASLIDRDDVRDDLMKVDYVSVKLDAIYEQTWRKINKPHRDLKHERILHGIQNFSKGYSGTLTTETMLLKDINDDLNEMNELAFFIQKVKPAVSYLAIPTRPPAFKEAIPIDESKLLEVFVTFRKQIPQVELLTGYEGNAFSSSGDLRKDILSITAVHPLRQDAISALHEQSKDSYAVVDQLIEEQLIEKVEYNGHQYYLRKFSKGK